MSNSRKFRCMDCGTEKRANFPTKGKNLVCKVCWDARVRNALRSDAWVEIIAEIVK